MSANGADVRRPVGSRTRSIAIVGAGNGGFAAAADLGRRGFAVRLWGRNAETIEAVRTQGGVEYTGALGEGFQEVPLATTDLGTAIRDADIVMIAVPTQAHAAVAALLAPFLDQRQIVFAAPGHTVLLIPSTLRTHGVRAPVTCETATLPYICRKDGPGRIRITKPAQYLPFAVFPARDTNRVHAAVRAAYPATEPMANVLGTVFPYTNAVHHPPAALCNVGRIEATQGDYYHYYDGISSSVGRLIDALDEERRAVGAALGVAVTPFVEQFYRMGYTTAAARETGFAYQAFHQSEPDRWIRAPASIRHRFFDEDIPYGLVPLSELGRLGGVPTPVMDHLIHLASIATGNDYRSAGLTLERMGLGGVARDELDDLLMNGFPD
jgi:opine dehydrogenase